MIRIERDDDQAAIAEVTAAAFGRAEHSAPPQTPGGPPGEVTLLEWLRGDPGWLPQFSLVATWSPAPGEEVVIGHAVATRGYLDTTDTTLPALGVGPVSVHPDHQDQGVGSALMGELIARTEADGERLLALLGDPAYYARFGFEPAQAHGIATPDPTWGDFFQVRVLSDPVTGSFRYAAPFDRLG